MRGFIKNRLGRAGKDQKGFTLIEMLVVVGIIVALAAIIVPLVISFAGSGEEAARDGEFAAIKSALQTLMVENDVEVIELAVVAAPGDDFLPATVILTIPDPDVTFADFIDEVTSYCYVWTSAGRITAQYLRDSAGACTATGGPINTS